MNPDSLLHVEFIIDGLDSLVEDRTSYQGVRVSLSIIDIDTLSSRWMI
jgi:hypothetical protein